jgi:vacuolar-type H+-ATPase subunit H
MDTSTHTGASGGAVKDQVQQVREEVQETASRAIGGAQEQVQELTGKARGQVRDQIDQRISQTGERAESTADDLRAVAKELRNSDNAAPAAKVADQLADRVEGVARYLRQGDVDSILRDVESFGRRQPWAVLAGGLALGFAASRMLKASSSQRYGSSGGGAMSGNTSTRSRDEIRSGLESSSYLSGGTSSTAIGETAPRPEHTPPVPHAPQ